MHPTQLNVQVRCTDLPGRTFTDGDVVRAPVFLGIQRDQEVLGLTSGDAEGASFEAEFRIGRQKEGAPNFLGPYAFGTRHDRFFYLVWAVKKSGGSLDRFRRLKIRLGHLGWKDIEHGQHKPPQVHLRLTDKKGGPLCATPPPELIDWRL